MSGCIGGSCVARKWAGMGTTVDKPTNAALAKENNDKLAAILAERATQDTFLQGSKEDSSHAIVQVTVEPAGQTTVEVPVYDKKKTRGF